MPDKESDVGVCAFVTASTVHDRSKSDTLRRSKGVEWYGVARLVAVLYALEFATFRWRWNIDYRAVGQMSDVLEIGLGQGRDEIVIELQRFRLVGRWIAQRQCLTYGLRAVWVSVPMSGYVPHSRRMPHSQSFTHVKPQGRSWPNLHDLIADHFGKLTHTVSVKLQREKVESDPCTLSGESAASVSACANTRSSTVASS